MFMPQAQARVVPAEGPRTAKIAIVGEAPGAFEDRILRPFQGPAGKVLDQCLHSAGLVRSNVYITNLVKVRPPGNNISAWYHPKQGLTDLGKEAQAALLEELRQTDATVIVPMGNVPLAAITGKSGITNVRGYPFECIGLPDRVAIPTIHPAAALRGMYIWRYYIMHDLMKAKRHVGMSEHWAKRDLIVDFTFEEACEWIEAHNHQERVSFDIEVINYEVSCISLTSKSNYAISIPFYQAWSAEQEAHLWSLVSELLFNPDVKKVGQNLVFDISFLVQRNKIVTRGEILDTMIGHSIMYPDFEKGLGFLASIYTDQGYWKDMMDWKNIKKES